jgi:predicted lipid-binding transport protein (Tim44 family)
MFTSFALIKAFFSHWLGIVIGVTVIVLALFCTVEYFHIRTLNTTIASLNQKIGSSQATAAQFEAAASDCSANTQALAQADAAATASAAVAVSEATVKAKTRTAHAKTILAQKPTGTDDYANSKALMDQLIDNRQANQP